MTKEKEANEKLVIEESKAEKLDKIYGSMLDCSWDLCLLAYHIDDYAVKGVLNDAVSSMLDSILKVKSLLPEELIVAEDLTTIEAT